MNLIQRTIGRGIAFVLVLALCALPLVAQQQATGTLRGQVLDEFGGVIIGASVIAVDTEGRDKTVTTDEQGNFTLAGLVPGRYTVRAVASGFAIYENADVNVAPGANTPLKVVLGVSLEIEEVTVASEAPISLENRADAVVLRGKDLEALPDDPDELAAALQALAGPSVGPNGGQIMIDGFEGGRIPPRDSIREIRINENPLSAERDQPGFGGIQIFTKPGTDKLRGSIYTTFMDESLNSRNPFAERRAPFQFRQYGGNLSGTIIPKRASFFFDLERSETDDNDIVNATILDPATLAPNSFVTTVLTPARRLNLSPRFDYQINQSNTLVARYNFFQVEQKNLGVSNFSLPERAFDQKVHGHTLQLTETAVLGKSAINETRFQFIRNRREQTPLTDAPALNVLEAFFAGGAQTGLSFNEDSRYELSNQTSISHGNHSTKFGGRLRGSKVTDVSRNNFGGTYVFGGGPARSFTIDSNGQIVAGPAEFITSLERFRRTRQLQQRGATAAQIQALGLGPTQLSLSGGDPEADISQVDFGGFVQDDWKLRPNLTIGAGLRYEAQSNISSHFNFAPRFYVAWSPDGTGGRQPKTVIRLGLGMFYDRIADSLSLQANRYNGVDQLRFVVTDPAILARFPAIPTLAELGTAQQQTTTRLAPDITAPYSYTSGLIIERQLPKKFTVFGFLMTYNSRHVLRSRNVNAPLPGSFTAQTPNGVRPIPGSGDIYQFESSGTQNLKQVNIGIRNQFNRAFSIFANYNYFTANGDADGPFSFPANSYDLSTEYGRTSFDVRHRFNLGGSIGVPYLNLLLNPIIIASSGRPFNITTGVDNNRDGIFNDRPAFATAETLERDLRRTPFGDFDINPKAGQAIIPRNYGEGPGFFSVNLRISRQFGFGSLPGQGGDRGQQGGANNRGGQGGQAAGQQRGGGGPGGAGGGRPVVGGPGGPGGPGGGGPGGPFGGGGGGGGEQKRYNLTVSLFVSNLLNHTNLNNPVGNLSSPRFGQSLSTVSGFGFGGGNPAAGNRRVQMSVRFNF